MMMSSLLTMITGASSSSSTWVAVGSWMSLVMFRISPVAEKLAIRKSTMMTNMSTSGVISSSALVDLCEAWPCPKTFECRSRFPKRLPGVSMAMSGAHGRDGDRGEAVTDALVDDVDQVLVADCILGLDGDRRLIGTELLLHVLEPLGELGEVDLLLRIPADRDGVERAGAHRQPQVLLREEERHRNGLVVLVRGLPVAAASADLQPTDLSPDRGHEQEADGNCHQVDEGAQVDGGVQGLLGALGITEVHPAGHACVLRSLRGWATADGS